MAPSLDPRLPIIVGSGQIMIRDASTEPLEPAELMAEALRRAEFDSGGRGLLAGADQVLTVSELSWRYRNPALAVANLVGASPRRLATSVVGGNLAGVMVARAAAEIQRGSADVILLTGGEATRTRSRLRKADVEPAWSTQSEDVPPPQTIGDLRPLVNEIETERGVRLPVHVYPLFEVALRARLGLNIEDHINRIGALWAAFSEVAATNPNAWIRTPLSSSEITSASPDNRMIAWPYTKRLCSNNQVDQGAAVILTSVAAAERAGVPRDRWVFLHAGAEAIDHWNVSNRVDLCSSPALRVAGRNAYALAGVTSGDIDHVDLYSCFPAAVQIGAIELGLMPSHDVGGEGWGGVGATRPLTVTGGMTFAGGPFNNYTTHGLASMAERLRSDPGSVGLCTANGGYTTEHAVLLASSEPPKAGEFRYANPQAEVDTMPRVECDDAWTGPVAIESATVIFDSAPSHALIATRTPEGTRSWGSSVDPDFMDAAMTTELVGTSAYRHESGIITIS
ncbi:MAG: acetyl-CoA acetyltransferase [Acidimicrobiales bacterium]